MTFEQAMGKMRNPIDNPRVISDRAEKQRKWQDLSGMLRVRKGPVALDRVGRAARKHKEDRL